MGEGARDDGVGWLGAGVGMRQAVDVERRRRSDMGQDWEIGDRSRGAE